MAVVASIASYILVILH